MQSSPVGGLAFGAIPLGLTFDVLSTRSAKCCLRSELSQED